MRNLIPDHWHRVGGGNIHQLHSSHIHDGDEHNTLMCNDDDNATANI